MIIADLIALVTAPSTLWCLGNATAAGVLVSIVERRLGRPRTSEWLVCILFWTSVAGSQWLLTRWPTRFDAKLFLPNQLWERLLWPALAILTIATIIGGVTKERSAFRSLVTVSLALVGMLAALPFAPIWSEFVPENAYWLSVVAMAVAWNVWGLESMVERGAERWVLWVLVAHLGLIAAILLASYATLGNWCLCVLLTCASLAVVRGLQPEGDWIRPLFLPVLFLACGLTPMIRFYSTQPLSWAWYGYLLFFPSALAVIDRFVGSRFVGRTRIAVSAVSAVCLSSLAIAAIWGGTGAIE